MRSVTLGGAAVLALAVLLAGCAEQPPTAPIKVGDSQSSRDDSDDESNDSETEEAPDFSLDDLAALSVPASVDGLTVTTAGTPFDLSGSYDSFSTDWQSSGNTPDDCFRVTLASGLLDEADGQTGDQAVNLGFVDNAWQDGRLASFGRVLDSADDAEELLSGFAESAERCSDGFQVQRGDGFWDVAGVDYRPAGITVPPTVAASTLDYRIAGASPTGFRMTYLQRGNAVVAVFAIVQPTSAFSVASVDQLATSIAESLAALD